jgi:hypothetical protein
MEAAEQPPFTPAQWAALPPERKAYFRALKHQRRAQEKPAAPAPPAATPAGHALPVDATPFCDTLRRPIYLHNFGQGAACFVVLSGPSLRTLDLSQLSRRGIFTIGVNNSPTVLRTNAWTYVDTPCKFHDAIWRDPACMKFVTVRHFDRGLRMQEGGKFRSMLHGDAPVLARQMPGVIGLHRNAEFRPAEWLSEASINWGNSKRCANKNKQPNVLNVMFCVLKVAYAIGFRVVYLLGCDFKMSADNPYAFEQGKSAGGAQSNNNCYRLMNGMFSQLLPYFEAAGFRVFNCNPESGLTVFPHLPYSEAIRAASGHIPQDPLSSAGWYDI